MWAQNHDIVADLGGVHDIHNMGGHSYSEAMRTRKYGRFEDRLRDIVCDRSLDLAIAQQEIIGN